MSDQDFSGSLPGPVLGGRATGLHPLIPGQPVDEGWLPQLVHIGKGVIFGQKVLLRTDRVDDVQGQGVWANSEALADSPQHIVDLAVQQQLLKRENLGPVQQPGATHHIRPAPLIDRAGERVFHPGVPVAGLSSGCKGPDAGRNAVKMGHLAADSLQQKILRPAAGHTPPA